MIILKILGVVVLAIFVLWLTTGGIGYDDSNEPNQFDID